MIRQTVLALTLALSASPALSLSCMRPDVVRMFEYARDSDDIYYVIKGRLTPSKPYAIPEPKTSAPGDLPSTADTPVGINGMGLGSHSFSVSVEVGATVRLKCLSVWCAGPPPESELLMIVKKSNEDLVLDVGPCGGTAIPWSAEAEKRLLECHRSDSCKPAEF